MTSYWWQAEKPSYLSSSALTVNGIETACRYSCSCRHISAHTHLVFHARISAPPPPYNRTLVIPRVFQSVSRSVHEKMLVPTDAAIGILFASANNLGGTSCEDMRCNQPVQVHGKVLVTADAAIGSQFASTNNIGGTSCDLSSVEPARKKFLFSQLVQFLSRS
jgi:hypothetical protein